MTPLDQPSRARSVGTNPRRRGAVLIVVALLLVALVGMMALTLEGGMLLAERRHAQSIADASALAAACDLSYNYGFNAGSDPQGTAQTSALAIAAANGYTNDGTNSTVALRISQATTGGTVNGVASSFPTFRAEVNVTYYQPRGFSAIFGSKAPMTVSGRGVASGGDWQYAKVALLLLEPSLPASLTVAANTGLTVVNGPVESNSTSPLATALALNSRITVQSGAFYVRGGTAAVLNGPVSPSPTNTSDPFADPLAYLDPPDPSTLPIRTNSLLTIGLGQNITLQPGVYRGGIQILSTANVTMQPGIYYMAGGGLKIAGLGSLTGKGVTIVNAPLLPVDAICIGAMVGGDGTLALLGNGSVELTPPTTGLYQGITIMQAPALVNLPLGINPPLAIAANSLLGGTFSIAGTIYAPKSTITLAANGNTQLGSQVIARSAIIGANGLLGGTVRINWTPPVGRSPKPVRLVE